MSVKILNVENDDAKTLGLCVLSKLSSINYLGKTGMPIKGLIMVEKVIGEIECGLWSLIPLAIGNDQELFEDQLKHIKEKFTHFIDTIKTTDIFMQTMKKNDL